jgi:4-amino-4-deoxy-L-arabinose transferase-like glycosyltransferase
MRWRPSSPRARLAARAERTHSGGLRLSAEAFALAALLAAAGTVYARSLDSAANYDEGNYLASLDALRHGQTLGGDIFVDQPPGWYLLLRVDAFLFGNSVSGVRTGLLLFSLLALVAAWACGRALAGPPAGLAAAALVAIAPPFPAFATRVEADPPATVLSLIALALAAWAFRGRNRRSLAFGAGSAFVLALSVKLLAIVAAPPLLAIALRRRDRWPTVAAVAAGGLVVAGAFLIAYAGVLHPLWTGVYTAHAHSRTHVPHQPGVGDNVHRVLHFLDLHTPFGWLVPVGIVAALLLRARSLMPLWLFSLSAVAFTVAQKPLLDHHLVVLAVALAVPAGVGLGVALEALPRRLSAAGIAVVVAAAGAALYQQHRQLARNDRPEPPQVIWAAEQLRARTAPSDLVAGDLPIVPYLARRRMPGSLIDSSLTRVVGEFTTPREILRLIDRSGARAVVVGRNYTSKPVIVDGIRRRFPRHERRDGLTIYLR